MVCIALYGQTKGLPNGRCYVKLPNCSYIFPCKEGTPRGPASFMSGYTVGTLLNRRRSFALLLPASTSQRVQNGRDLQVQAQARRLLSLARSRRRSEQCTLKCYSPTVGPALCPEGRRQVDLHYRLEAGNDLVKVSYNTHSEAQQDGLLF